MAVACEARLVAFERPAYVLDGDNLRHGLNGDLGFSAADRAENVRRVGHVARLMADAGVVVLVPLISPYRADRDAARALHDDAGLPFLEVFVDTPIELCEQRDPKGLYAKARAGEIQDFTGIDDPYEAPTAPELVLRPADGDARGHGRSGAGAARLRSPDRSVVSADRRQPGLGVARRLQDDDRWGRWVSQPGGDPAGRPVHEHALCEHGVLGHSRGTESSGSSGRVATVLRT